MSKPVVAIVGRPNVGKSSLFNTLYGERLSIVADTPGVTRDRIYAETSWRDREFLMIDTGGIEPGNDEDIILKQMRLQAEIAIETADVILFMCDLKAGLTAADEEIAKWVVDSEKTDSTFTTVNPGITKITVKVKVIVSPAEGDNKEKSYTMKRKFQLEVFPRDKEPGRIL